MPVVFFFFFFFVYSFKRSNLLSTCVIVVLSFAIIPNDLRNTSSLCAIFTDRITTRFLFFCVCVCFVCFSPSCHQVVRRRVECILTEIDDVIGVRQLLPLYGVHFTGPKLTPLPEGLMPYYAAGHGHKRNNVLHASYTYTSPVVVLAPFVKEYVRCMLYHARVALVDGRFDFRAFYTIFSPFRIVPRE